jgi:hypothetical protein
MKIPEIRRRARTKTMLLDPQRDSDESYTPSPDEHNPFQCYSSQTWIQGTFPATSFFGSNGPTTSWTLGYHENGLASEIQEAAKTKFASSGEARMTHPSLNKT